MRVYALLTVLALMPLAAARPARAADVTLTQCTEPEFDAALAAAAGGGSIFFSCDGPATISFQATKVIASAVQISGDELITLSGGAGRVFMVEAGGRLGLDGLAITGGRAAAARGGAIFNRGTLTLDNVAFIGNSADSGGAIFTTGVVTATASTFIGNSAAADGGAIAIDPAGSATISTSAFRGNAAGGAGGAITSAGRLWLETSALRGNEAGLGGALAITAGSPFVRTTVIDANRARQSGGGLYNRAALTLDKVTLSANSAAADGGGAWNGGTLDALNITASGNRAAQGGGIANGGALSLNNATLAANSARGGGLLNAPAGTARLANTLLAGNSDPAAQSPDCAGPIASQGANLIQNPAGCGITTAADDIVGADPLLGPLADNGGATPTHALLVASPAIDAGNRLYCATTDQRGVGRPVGVQCDIGAYEQGLVVNSAADAPDANLRDPVCETEPGNRQCTLRAAVQQANGTPGVDAVEFAAPGPFVLTREGASEDASQGDLDITDDLLLSGRGADSTIIDGGGNPLVGGVLHVAPGASATIAALTIRNGNAGAGGFGGNIRNDGSVTLLNSRVIGGSAASGGGIANFGRLAVRMSSLADNSANAGGGVYNRYDASVNPAGGTMALSNVTLSGNSATGLLGGGGGIDNQGQAALTNVTVSGNSARRDGGGIRVQASGLQALTLNNVSLVDNVADALGEGAGDGGGIFSGGGVASIKNTIVANNSDRSGQAPDCALRAGFNPSLVSLGYNLLGTAAGCPLASRPGDQFGSASPIDPRLGPLQASGASSVRPPLTGSPAINAGSPAPPGGQGNACSDTDQRGRARPEGGSCDIGASEAILSDVSVLAPALPERVFVGEMPTLTIDVVNAGPSSTDNVGLEVQLPPQLALVSATPSQGNCAAVRPVSCALDTLKPGGSARVSLVVRVTGAGALDVRASTRAVEADPNIANNAGALRSTAFYRLLMPLAARR